MSLQGAGCTHPIRQRVKALSSWFNCWRMELIGRHTSQCVAVCCSVLHCVAVELLGRHFAGTNLPLKSSLRQTPFSFRDTMRSNTQTLDRIMYGWSQGDGEEAKLRRLLPLSAESGHRIRRKRAQWTRIDEAVRITHMLGNTQLHCNINSTATGKAFPQKAFLNCAEPNICATPRELRAAAAGRTAEEPHFKQKAISLTLQKRYCRRKGSFKNYFPHGSQGSSNIACVCRITTNSTSCLNITKLMRYSNRTPRNCKTPSAKLGKAVCGDDSLRDQRASQVFAEFLTDQCVCVFVFIHSWRMNLYVAEFLNNQCVCANVHVQGLRQMVVRPAAGEYLASFRKDTYFCRSLVPKKMIIQVDCEFNHSGTTR